MVNDQVHGNERVDLLWIAAKACHCRAHGSQVNNCRNTGEVLHHDARREKSDTGAGRFWRPGRDVPYIFLGNFLVIALAQCRFQHNTDRVWELLELRETCFFQCVETVDYVLFISHF